MTYYTCRVGQCFSAYGPVKDCIHETSRKSLSIPDDATLELAETAQELAERRCAEVNRARDERYYAAERYQQEYNFVVDLLRRIKASRIPPSAGGYGTGAQLRFMGSHLPLDLQYW